MAPCGTSTGQGHVYCFLTSYNDNIYFHFCQCMKIKAKWIIFFSWVHMAAGQKHKTLIYILTYDKGNLGLECD